jgi:hypothetical protein
MNYEGNCKMQIARCKLTNAEGLEFAICNLQFAICNSGRCFTRRRRAGGVYIAVLGTSLIVSLLALCALLGQRIQNRMLVAASDIRQAQLNADAAVELALLNMKQDANWRSTYTSGNWIASRGTTAGSCTVNLTDPVDSNLSDDPDEPVVISAIGTSGNADQRCEVTVESRRQPVDILRASANAGGIIAGQNTFDWSTVISAYSGAGIGTTLNYASLPTATQFEFARNTSINSNADYWDDDPPGLPSSSFNAPQGFGGHAASLRVDRNDKRAGAGNRLQVALLKPNTSYQVSIEVHPDLNTFQTNRFKVFMLTQYVDGTYVESAGSTTAISYLANVWTTLTATITTPNWTEEPANVYLVINSDHASGQAYRFYIDNIHVYENVTGRLLYGQSLGPTVANPNGIYWIDCGGGKLLIERSRILGTLVVLNPGAGSAIANGPIHMSPATPGYPVLMVNGNFAIRSTSRVLNESEYTANFNPGSMPYEFNNPLAGSTDNNLNDAYPSEIQGLVAVSGNLTFENAARLRGQAIVGGTVSGTYSLNYQPGSMINPPPSFYGYRYETRPTSVRKVVLP